MSKPILIAGASKQPFNQYAGGPTGIQDSEYWWMQTLSEQIAAELRPEFEVYVVPRDDLNKDGKLDFNDNVRYINNLITQLGKQGKKVTAIIMNHSNAAGDSMVLSGQSSASLALRKKFVDEFNRHNIMPFNDVWTHYSRLVSEMSKTNAPGVLLEFGRHDKIAYAQWLRENISSGRLARWAADRIRTIFGVTRKPVPKPPITSPVGPQFPEQQLTEDNEMKLTDNIPTSWGHVTVESALTAMAELLMAPVIGDDGNPIRGQSVQSDRLLADIRKAQIDLDKKLDAILASKGQEL